MVELAASGQHYGRTPDGYREVARNGDVSGRMWAISARGRRTSRVTACRCRTAREQTVAHKVLSAGLRRVPRRRCSETSIAARLTRGLQGADDPAESVIVGIGREWVRQTTGAGRGLHLRSLGGNIGGTPNLRGGSRRRLLPTSSWSRRTERWSGRADRRSGRRGGAASDPSRRTTGRRAGLHGLSARGASRRARYPPPGRPRPVGGVRCPFAAWLDRPAICHRGALAPRPAPRPSDAHRTWRRLRRRRSRARLATRMSSRAGVDQAQLVSTAALRRRALGVPTALCPPPAEVRSVPSVLHPAPHRPQAAMLDLHAPPAGPHARTPTGPHAHGPPPSAVRRRRASGGRRSGVAW